MGKPSYGGNSNKEGSIKWSMVNALLHDDEISLFPLFRGFSAAGNADAIVNDSMKMDDVTDSEKLPSSKRRERRA